MSIEFAVLVAATAMFAGVIFIERANLKAKLLEEVVKLRAEAALEAVRVKDAAEAEAKQIVLNFTSGVTQILHKIYNEVGEVEKAVVAKIKEELTKL